ncbi:MAG: hypothetical protein ACRD3T_09685 [Terriglobia bacterium]
MLTRSISGPFRTRRIAVFAWMALVPAVALRAANRARGPEHAAVEWKTPARWRHGLRSTPGTVFIGPRGIRFQAERRNSMAWPYEEIQTFYASPRRLLICSYTSRGWHLPGTRSFRFDLGQPLPPAVATRLSRRIGKPSRNADPMANAPAFAALAARHPTRLGGSNGMLRFRDRGIDYVTRGVGDGRSWQWADIQTIANPDPYHFRVTGFRETYDFDLKQPMSEALFDRLWDSVYGRGLELGVTTDPFGNSAPIARTGMNEER